MLYHREKLEKGAENVFYAYKPNGRRKECKHSYSPIPCEHYCLLESLTQLRLWVILTVVNLTF